MEYVLHQMKMNKRIFIPVLLRVQTQEASHVQKRYRSEQKIEILCELLENQMLLPGLWLSDHTRL